MAGLSGPQLQDRLAALGCRLPIVFISGHGDIPTTVQTIKAGAEDFLTKPVKDQDLFEALSRAEAMDAELRQLRSELDVIRRKVRTLTPREREVLTHVVAGRLNKQIAGELGAAEKTIKVHRARVMQKMQVQSVAELVRASDRLGLH